MVKFTTYLRSMLVAAIGLFSGVSAQAQFSGAVDQYPTSGYEGSPIEFTLSEVATALSTDAATLGAAIDEYVKAETPATVLFAANGTDWTAALEAANHGFWMAADGTPVGYGDNSVWYCSPEVDEAFTKLTFNVGQMPNVMKEGEKGETTITLKFNEKTATFVLTLNVIAKPAFDVPEPTLKWADLTIVGEQEKIIEQYPRGGYDSDAIKINISQALTLLGITNKTGMSENLEKVLYATVYNTADVEQGGGMKKDSLSNTSTAGAPGWWMRAVQNEQGEETGEVSAAGWGDTDKFYIEAFAYNAETDTLSCNLGQYPGSCKDNETWFTYIYIVYGDKAYRIKYTLKLLEKEQGNGLADFTKVGEGAATVEQEPTTDYSTSSVTIDVEAIATALGCEVSALGVVALDDKDNFGGSTANNGGWWLTSSGTVTSWGSGAAFFIEPATANDWSKLNVGQYPSVLSIGDEVSANIYFVNGTNYYQQTITLKIVEPKKQEFIFESVETRSIAVQQLLDNAYTMNDLGTINLDDVATLIGTSDPVLYGVNIDSVATVKGEYSKAWSCDPKPGFWLNKEGEVSVWGDANATMGIVYADGKFRGCQYPNRCEIGQVFKTLLFLVNEETGKMITFNIQISFVESLVEKTVVGEESIRLPISVDGANVEIDLTKAATALEVTVDDLLNTSNYYLRGMKDGVYGEGQNVENGLSFAADGSYDGYGSIYFTIAKEGEKTILNIGSNDAVAADYSVNGQFCFEVNDKQYVYYVNLVSPEIYASGISTVKADAKAGNIYDLQGRQVMKAQRGLYIMNGKKVIVK